jgi:hypothetical protein
MVLEPGPFTTPAPWPDVPRLQAPTAFVTRGAPYLTTIADANAAIRAAHSAIAPFASSGVEQAFTTDVAPALAALDTLAPAGDAAELGAVLEALDVVLADVDAQTLDLPGPEADDLSLAPDPGPPPGWEKEGEATAPTPPTPPTPTPGAPAPGRTPTPGPTPGPSPEPSPEPTPEPTPEPSPEPSTGPIGRDPRDRAR